MITANLLVKSGCCNPVMADKWADALSVTCDQFKIDTGFRMAGFLSQVAHESAGFTAVVENLNYSAQGLANTWPNRFAVKDAGGNVIKPISPNVLAQTIQRQPELIANSVYSSRMGNGDEASGDGWKYRGRGLIQITGKDNYASFAMACDVDALIHPEIVEQPDNAALSAGWFWYMRGLNVIADTGDVELLTRKINGGLNGLDDRRARYNQIIAALTGTQ